MTELTLTRALAALAPVLDRLVVAGGTAHRLFPMHPLGRDPGFEPLFTEDVDVALPLELQHDGGRELLDRLAEAGFEEEARGAGHPTYVYRLREERDSYLQFIANLRGDGIRRDGKSDRLMSLSGIQAEKLRHVDVLLHAPWQATLRGASEEHRFQVVNPIAYLVQKLLVLEDRGRKRAKDLLYVFDTLTMFAESLRTLGEQAPELVPRLSKNALGKLGRTVSALCFRESDVSREAALIAREQRGRPPDSAQIVGACEVGLRRALGSLTVLG